MDRTTLCKLDLSYRLYPPPIWKQIRKMKEAGQWVREVDLCYVPAKIRGATGQSQTGTAMIKFYHLEGKTLCFIIGSKEEGVVD